MTKNFCHCCSWCVRHKAWAWFIYPSVPDLVNFRYHWVVLILLLFSHHSFIRYLLSFLSIVCYGCALHCSPVYLSRVHRPFISPHFTTFVQYRMISSFSGGVVLPTFFLPPCILSWNAAVTYYVRKELSKSICCLDLKRQQVTRSSLRVKSESLLGHEDTCPFSGLLFTTMRNSQLEFFLQLVLLLELHFGLFTWTGSVYPKIVLLRSSHSIFASLKHLPKGFRGPSRPVVN